MPTASVPAACTVAIVGAGPAGMAAATLAADLGLEVVLIDQQPHPGGQIYRANGATSPDRRPLPGDEYAHGASLFDALSCSGARFVSGAMVVSVTPGGAGIEIGLAVDRKPATIVARKLILATGAQERPFPIPGWTLPGVMSAGAAQVLLKSAAIVPEQRTVVAGCGPFIYLVAWQMLQAGVELAGIIDTLQRARLLRALPHAWQFARSQYYKEQASILQEVNESVAIFRGATAIAALGNERLVSVRYVANGTVTTLLADQLFLHQGFVPDVILSGAIGCDHEWDDALLCWKPRVDRWGASSMADVYIAGDAAGIVGARAAEHRGRLAALAAAAASGHIGAAVRDRDAAPHFAALARALRGRAFGDSLYRPAEQFRKAEGATIVCRCEKVTAHEIVGAMRGGSPGTEELKASLRCGAGACQGRLCALTINELVGRERGEHPRDTGMLRARFPLVLGG
ncbi:MAG TPA: NAD(P)/FAD-dependent oxidoreductase [Casimicrobiaceae bacterium]|nr:NAD(P)/FAD-dependent oxidoreductase [Casimicrobiaceae bacterium]